MRDLESVRGRFSIHCAESEGVAMQTIRRVGVLSVAKIAGAIYGVLGLIFAPFFLLVGLAAMASGEKEAAFGAAFGIVFAVLMPVFYAVMGFLFGALAAWLYNVLSKWTGGIEVELVPAA